MGSVILIRSEPSMQSQKQGCACLLLTIPGPPALPGFLAMLLVQSPPMHYLQITVQLFICLYFLGLRGPWVKGASFLPLFTAPTLLGHHQFMGREGGIVFVLWIISEA